MNINAAVPASARAVASLSASPHAPTSAVTSPEFHQAFNKFVGETFYGTMLKSMRRTVGKAAYFHGGQAEEMFTQQLDQVMAEKLGKVSGDKFSAPMLKLYQLQRM